jgi:5-formyltetrahydrofolate cyclo-ligase
VLRERQVRAGAMLEHHPNTSLKYILVAESTSSPAIDLILMPGMAFDRTLARLGHGKGYYDRFITGYRALLEGHHKGHEVLLCTSRIAPPQVALIYSSDGLSLDEQILEDGAIPMTETDARLDVLVTAQGTLS